MRQLCVVVEFPGSGPWGAVRRLRFGVEALTSQTLSGRIVNLNLVEGWRSEPLQGASCLLNCCWCVNETRATGIKLSGLNAWMWLES